jgi:sulfatase maturation enzyme AslB (radical SAM superfamily)
VSFSSLQFVLTDDCNFSCRYCYRFRGEAILSPGDALRAVRLFVPRAKRGFAVYFYGGEPLLRFDLIRGLVPEVRSLARASGRRPRFGLTTNGSLIGEDELAFLEKNRFALLLSFDGSAQDRQRAAGSEVQLRRLIQRILEGGRIRLGTNSVFTPETVGELSRSLRGLIEAGVPAVHFNLSYLTPWGRGAIDAFDRELAALGRYLTRHYRKTGLRPVSSLNELALPRLRHCAAGDDRLAVDPHGRIWGCAIFSDWARQFGGAAAARRFSHGTVSEGAGSFDKKAARVASAYSAFSMDRVDGGSGPCRLCPELERCWICPAVSAMAGGGLRHVPAFACELQRIKARRAARLAGALDQD